MATLYTPAPQREGLDWLGGMVRDAQQLWQNQAKIAQQAKQLDLQRQQQKMQEEHFWVEQARLKGQEDFQNRKFLYGMKQDEVTNAMKEKEYGLNERATDYSGRRVTLAEQEAERAADPNSPEAQERRARTESYGASAEQTRAETDYSFGPKSPQPKVTTYWWGETGTASDFLNAYGKSINKGYVDQNSLALSPDQEKIVREQGVKPGDWLRVKLNDGNVVERRWDDKTRDDLRGRWDFHGGEGPDKNDGKRVVGFQPKSADDDFFTPVGGQRTGGGGGGQIATPPGMRPASVTTGKGGRIASQTFVPNVAPRQYADPIQTQINTDRDDLLNLRKSLKPIPDAPTLPPAVGGAGKAQNEMRLKIYTDQINETNANNAVIREQIKETEKRIEERETKLKVKDLDLDPSQMTPAFRETGAKLIRAMKSDTPATALRELRPEIEAHAQKGDETAVAVLDYLDKTLPNRPPLAPPQQAKAPADLFKK